MDESPEDQRHHKSGRRPWLRVDGVVVDKRSTKTGGYRVKIEGVNIRGAISPPTITVGGQHVTEMQFAPDGRSMTGVIHDLPANEYVVVDYGFAKTVYDPKDSQAD